jgi:predicted O-methyltransferase YrrM
MEQKNAGFPSKDLADANKRRNWSFSFGIHVSDRVTTFYDTDGDGTLDLILVDADGDKAPEVAFRAERRRLAPRECNALQAS